MASRRTSRLTCEPLEGRALLSATLPFALATGDLDGDGQMELVVADGRRDRVGVFHGAGEAPEGVLLEGGLGGPRDIRLVDLDGDGRLDLLVLWGPGRGLSALRGLGEGVFDPGGFGPTTLGDGSGPQALAVADLDDDGLPDLVVADQETIAVLLGRVGPGTWWLERGQEFRLQAGGEGDRHTLALGPVSLTLADADNDGRHDLVITREAADLVWILRGLEKGRFDDLHPLALPTGAGPHQALVADFDGDGRADLVTLNRGPESMTYYPDVGAPKSEGRSLSSGGVPVTGLVWDVDQDGTSDLVVANAGPSSVAWMRGGVGGPQLAEVVAQPKVDPVALAVVPSAKGGQFYLADAGTGALVPVFFGTGNATRSRTGAPGAGEAGGEAGGEGASLAESEAANGPAEGLPASEGGTASNAPSDEERLVPSGPGAVPVLPLLLGPIRVEEAAQPAVSSLRLPEPAPVVLLPALRPIECRSGCQEGEQPVEGPLEESGATESESVGRFVSGAQRAIPPGPEVPLPGPGEEDLAVPGVPASSAPALPEPNGWDDLPGPGGEGLPGWAAFLGVGLAYLDVRRRSGPLAFRACPLGVTRDASPA